MFSTFFRMRLRLRFKIKNMIFYIPHLKRCKGVESGGFVGMLSNILFQCNAARHMYPTTVGHLEPIVEERHFACESEMKTSLVYSA